MDNLRELLKEKPLSVNDTQSKEAGPKEYCEICFISFGSQEPRLQKNGKTVHIDCAKSA